MCRIKNLAKKKWGWQFGEFFFTLSVNLLKKEAINLAIWRKLELAKCQKKSNNFGKAVLNNKYFLKAHYTVHPLNSTIKHVLEEESRKFLKSLCGEQEMWLNAESRLLLTDI